MSSADAELNATGVSVQHDVCDQAVCASCMMEVLQSLDRYLALPGTMNATSDRHFVHFSTLKGFTITKKPEHRRDFLLPISPPIHSVLTCILSGNIGAVLSCALGKNAEICEITAIISEPGAMSQPFHSDGNWSVTAPRYITLFLALQDILEEAMGPTRFCPETHLPRCFSDNEWLPPTDMLVSERGSEWYALNAGDAVLMDSTTWHCGSANRSARRRMLLSVTFVAAFGGEAEDGALDKLRVSDFMQECHC
mmetsp:Transcript_5616/g.8070  ORF Transcript_5616/g.8070 Transcript_5616/m.8070 type:complete len:252 (-) Transcript_5616:15-770(-)|eukprot:CAMPEP_0195516892 /NCGR_PEP_ID=MMETSP0794_2-20130614/8981_1 /TAXON_ID=515487 /ORGANISM="Stephanopyxis turris, Strain CCMP 815" /LENGTH=251 /DNA_ID=CAMNT_0040645603 /DNA_START=52 /DNA_END=807 /DNA_ORIENTATION=+